MNTFEDPGFDASDVVSVKETLGEFERTVRLELLLFYTLFNHEPQVFKDDAEMFRAHWAKVLG